MLNINFNGKDLSQWCAIGNISDMLLPPRTNNSKSVPIMNGSYYTGYKYGERTIDVDILIKGTSNEEFKQNLKELANVLNTKTPVKIISSRNPGRYVYGVLDGETNLEKLNRLSSITTITFLCNDPIIYSDVYRTFEPNQRGVFTLENKSNIESYPYVSVNFKADSSFAQITNFDGETVLIGRPPEFLEPTLPYPTLFENNMENPASLTSISDSLLPTGHFGGAVWTLVPGYNGAMSALGTTNYGSGDKWHGASGRLNPGREFEQYELCFEFILSSDSYFNPPVPEPLPPIAPPPTPENPSTTCLGTYKISTKAGLWVREQPNTSSKKLVAMEYGDKVYPTEISNGWAKVTYKNKYGNKLTYTGWSSMQYLSKVSDQKVRAVDPNTFESEVGAVQCYGFDINGTKQWQFSIADNSEFFEAATTSFIVENQNFMYEDPIAGRNPNSKVINEQGDTEYIASGGVGRFNNCHGRLYVTRTKNANGEFKIQAKMHKYKDWGTIVETIEMPNSIVTANKEKLSYLGFFVGTFGNCKPKKHMCLENITIKDLASQQQTEVNIPLFRAGDNLQVSFGDGTVTVNGQDLLDKVDIGSNFFSVPQGETRLVVRTQSDSSEALVGLRECFL